jgi:hypothetical protein
MHIKHLFLIFSLFIGFLLLSTQTIKACSCGGKPTIIDSLDKSQNVMIAEVTGVEKVDGYYKGIKSAKMSVKKVFKGTLKEGETVSFAQGGGSDCLWEFDEKFIGTKLLIYDSDTWSPFEESRKGIWGCGRSRNANPESADLLYLENLEKVRGKTRIYGSVWFIYGRENPQGRKVRIIGKDKTHEVITDKNGFYEIYDLPPGEYFLEPEIPKGWRIEENDLRLMLIARSEREFPKAESPTRFPLTLRERKDASQDFLYVADNAIRGRVIDDSGKPLKDICLAAVRADETTYKYSYGGCTNEQGQFEITGLDRNSYILVINGDGKINPKQPIKTLFYPGIKERSQAGIIKIAEGEQIVLKDFKVSEVLETLSLSGKLTYSDGTPVRREYVRFFPDKKDENIKGDSYGNFHDFVNDDGSFTIRIFKGQTGKLRAEMGFSKEILEICPEIKKAVLEIESSERVLVSTQWTEIKADKDLTDIKIVLPFPQCKRRY